jgi:thioredoxin reductase
VRATRNIIVGAGPAGLQLAYFLKRRGEPHLILERAAQPASFFARYPRHRRLLSINKVHTGCPDRESRLRYDWNSLLDDSPGLEFTRYTSEYFPHAGDLARYLGDYASDHGLGVRYDTRVTAIARAGAGGGFVVETSAGEAHSCERLFVATGLFEPNLPAIEGLELCENYTTVSVDPERFRDRRVLIVGKGNSAFETADNLIATTRKIRIGGPSTIRLAWGTRFVGDLRAINNTYLDTYHLKAQNNILDGDLVRVRRGDGEDLIAEFYFESRRRAYEFTFDDVIICTGFRFDSSIFAADCRPALWRDGKLPHLTCEWESTNVPGMFFGGTLMQMRDFRKTQSSFIHGFRHNLEALDQMLEARDGGGVWRKRIEVTADPAQLSAVVIERASTSAAMLLQPGFLGDCVGLRADGEVEYLCDIPVDYVHERLAGRYDELLLVTLEYREHPAGAVDPLAMPRGLGVEEDFYIHPIVRQFRAGAEVDRTFLPDDLDNDWRNEPTHLVHVEHWLAGVVGQRRPTSAPTVTQ